MCVCVIKNTLYFLSFQFLSLIIFDPFIDLFITLCILVNTLFMALDHHDMDPTVYDALKNGNYVSGQNKKSFLFGKKVKLTLFQ